MTHNSTVLLPDGKTSTHLFGCENREWYGLLVKVSSKKGSQIRKELTDILKQSGYDSAEKEGDWVFAKGAYSQETVNELEQYLSNSKHIIGSPIMPRGPYFSFIGYSWVDKYKEKY